jgi:heme-degrading monooxygenase HmoA
MLAARRLASVSRTFSSIPVINVASVLKLNVRDEPTAVKFDASMKNMAEKMKASPGIISATRHVCKAEWAYELSFVWDTKENFGGWKESALRDEVHEGER